MIDEAFTWGDDRPPKTPSHRTLIYEMHVKGFTKLNQEVPEELRGTYAGLSSEPAIRYLRELGVTAVELLPIHMHADDPHVTRQRPRQLLGLQHAFVLRSGAAICVGQNPAEVIQEFKTMVRNLHDAEHRSDSGRRLQPHRRRATSSARRSRFAASTTPAITACRRKTRATTWISPVAATRSTCGIRASCSSSWIACGTGSSNMHVDGFRFDLASTLARELHEVDKLGAFFDIIHQDPILSQVKLIAEPWDLGEGGYQVGNFPDIVVGMEWQVSRHRPPILER